MAHAFLSPSSTQRAYNCPASVTRGAVIERRKELLREVSVEFYGLSGEQAELHQSILDGDGGIHAVDGTKLHGLFERGVKKQYHLTKIKTEYEKLQLSFDDDFVLDKMCEMIISYNEFVKTLDTHAVEKRVKIKGLPQFGTVDFVGTVDRTLHIHDLKTGRGEVFAENNYQLMTYAVGVLDELGWDNFDEVVLKIIGVHFSDTSVTMTTAELQDFKMGVMLPAFMDAYGVNPTAKQGSWCRYCPAKLYCKEWRDTLDEEIDTVFQTNLQDVTNDDLVKLLNLGKQVETLVKSDVQPELLARFDTFDEPQGVKRNSGRTTTYWVSDEDVIVNELAKDLPEGEELFKHSLKTPKQVMKLLGDNADKVNDLIGTKQGNPYLTLTK